MDTITPKTNDEGQTAVLRSGDWLALRLRSAIADKEWAIACANMETAKNGWTRNWHEAMGAAQREIDAIEVDMGEARNLRIALQNIASATSPSQLFADADKQALDGKVPDNLSQLGSGVLRALVKRQQHTIKILRAQAKHSITPDYPEGKECCDYTLRADSAWLQVGKRVLHIVQRDKVLRVDLHRAGDEAEDPLDSCSCDTDSA